MQDSARAEQRIVTGLIAGTLFLSCLPYLFGYFITPPGMHFIGTVYNIDDYCVYLSWLRQTADGHFFLSNFFTTDPQTARQFNLFFWLLGQIVRLTHLSPQASLQIARVGGGVGLLWIIYRFFCFCLPTNPAARLTAFGFACLSSGLGWINWAHWQDKNQSGSPIDAWQPEAYTFLSIYASPLFTVSTLLIVGALYALLLGERTKQWRYPIIAGLCGAILGNIHSYDVLHLSAAWGLYLLVWTAIKRGRGVAASWLRGLLALGLTLPTTLYQYYIIQSDPVFRQRAGVPTLSPAFGHYMLGYGLVFVLAYCVLLLFFRRRQPVYADFADLQTRVMIICWAIAGLCVIYLPFAFQRKMLMGEHVPLCLLAGWAASFLTRHLAPRVQAWTLAALVLLSFSSNAFFLRRDLIHLTFDRSETSQLPYLSATLSDTYEWLRKNTGPDEGVIGPPQLCTYLPGQAGRKVWAGHWGETPHFGEKVQKFSRFADTQSTDYERRAFLAATRSRYLLYPNDVSGFVYTTRDQVTHRYADLAHMPLPYLKAQYSNKDYTIFLIALGN